MVYFVYFNIYIIKEVIIFSKESLKPLVKLEIVVNPSVWLFIPDVISCMEVVTFVEEAAISSETEAKLFA